MYAVIKSGGKQHKIKVGDILRLEKIEQGIGDKVTFDKVLMAFDENKDVKVGAPFLDGAKVVAEVLEQGRAKKVSMIKMRRRKSSMTRQGHRQYFTQVRIKEINVG